MMERQRTQAFIFFWGQNLKFPKFAFPEHFVQVKTLLTSWIYPYYLVLQDQAGLGLPLTHLSPSWHGSLVAPGITQTVWQCWKLAWGTSQLLTRHQKSEWCPRSPLDFAKAVLGSWIQRCTGLQLQLIISVSYLVEKYGVQFFVSQGRCELVWAELNWAVKLNRAGLSWVCCFVFLPACHWIPIPIFLEHLALKYGAFCSREFYSFQR